VFGLLVVCRLLALVQCRGRAGWLRLGGQYEPLSSEPHGKKDLFILVTSQYFFTIGVMHSGIEKYILERAKVNLVKQTPILKNHARVEQLNQRRKLKN